MKLSEAILLGSSAIPEGVTYSDCAIAAAVYAIGKHYTYHGKDNGLVSQCSKEEWPILRKEVLHPLTGNRYPLYMVIGDLNGFVTREGHWTRKQIAEWVATIEPQDEIVTEPGTLTDNINLSALVSK